MDDLGVFARDFGLRSQGKATPMSAARSSVAGAASAKPSFRSAGVWGSTESLNDYSDVFGGPPRNPLPSYDIGNVFATASPTSSAPVYDKPVYDDDIFDGVPGVRAPTGNVFDDVFAPPSRSSVPPPIDGLLESLGKQKAEPRSGGGRKVEFMDGFEELIPGFSRSSPPQLSTSSEVNDMHSKKRSVSADPFVVLETTSSSAYSPSGFFTDPLENINRTTISESTNTASPNEGAFDDTDDFEMLAKSEGSYTTSERNDNQNQMNSQRNIQDNNFGYSTSRKESPERSTVDPFEHLNTNVKNAEDNFESNDLFEKSLKLSSSTKKSADDVQNSDINVKMSERGVSSDPSPRSVDADEVWLTVAEIPLFTLPTTAPPPSRTPPIVSKQHPSRKGDYTAPLVFDADNTEPLLQSNQSRCIPQTDANEHADVFPDEVIGSNSAAAESVAAMKVAIDRAEVKFRQAREVREKVHDTKSTKIQQFQNQGNPTDMPDAQDDEDRKRQERLKHERTQKEKEEEEKRRERERGLELEREKERGRQAVERATREARERAAVEARIKAERAAAEKANADARLRAERAAVQKVTAEARERAAEGARERAAAEARERAAAEARERAAAEARERAERAAVEAAKERFAEAARERAAAEAREKAAAAAARERAAAERAREEARHRAERAAVDRASSEARERALAEARARAAATVREQQYNENDIESFFGMGVRATSAPKQRANSSETIFDTHNRGGMVGVQRTSDGPSSTFKKASSLANIGDDLTFLSKSSLINGFQEVEGETKERTRARIERQQRTHERAAKALAEKNERDLQVQREQAERHRIADTLDIEIKRWAAGKEGSLRALLSTLQYVLWPECGWQPVSLTDLITPASVKKVYRKATLCIHPDKVQQKGANLQQKYIAEKVFDILKEAWNKFNSEELF